jgi:hypothetical protein
MLNIMSGRLEWIREQLGGLRRGPDPVRRLSDDELLARADRIAIRLEMSREDAFAALDAGQLEGTVAGVELHTVRSLLNGQFHPTR